MNTISMTSATMYNDCVIVFVFTVSAFLTWLTIVAEHIQFIYGNFKFAGNS